MILGNAAIHPAGPLCPKLLLYKSLCHVGARKDARDGASVNMQGSNAQTCASARAFVKHDTLYK